MKSLDEFFPQVRMDCPQIALPIVRQAILDACREFCKKTKIWEEMKIFSLAPNKSEYKIALPENTNLQDITYLARLNTDTNKYDDRTRFKVTENDMDYEGVAGWGGWGNTTNWRDTTNDNADFWRWGIKADMKTVFIYPQPTVALADGVKAKLILSPDQGAFEVPDVLYDEYAEQIGSGAVARLMELVPDDFSGIPWERRMLIMKQKRRAFEKGVAAANGRNRSDSSRVKFRRLGR